MEQENSLWVMVSEDIASVNGGCGALVDCECSTQISN